MSDFNQQTRRQDKRDAPTATPSGHQTRQNQHGSIERNPDAPNDGNEEPTPDADASPDTDGVTSPPRP